MKHKKLKHMITAAAALTLSFALALTTSAAGSYIKYGAYSFLLDSDKNAVIHDYEGEALELYIPETIWGYTVVEIEDNAFFNRDEFTALYLEEGKQLRSIGSFAFSGCSSIPYAEIPAMVEEIGMGAFQNCAALSEVAFDTERLTEIKAQTFYRCAALAEVSIPESVVSIGAHAFGDCDSLAAVTIPDSVTEISDTAFAGSESVVIRAASNSCAIAYAIRRGIPYELTDEELLTYRRGDADGDGDITILDATRIQRVLVGLCADEDGLTALRAAVVDDTELSILDATAIQRYLADYDNNHEIGEEVTQTITLA